MSQWTKAFETPHMNTKEIFEFLKELIANNDRDWFKANREAYLSMNQSYYELAEKLLSLVAEIEPDATSLRVQEVVYRIYRDTRFSSDKTPYKNHVAIFINPPRGKKSLRYGYYFHLEPGASLIAAGNVLGPTALTNAIRKEIYCNIDEYLGIIKDPEFSKYFPTVGADPLLKAPAGFPKDWEHINLLKPRSFGALAQVPDSFYIESATLSDRMRPILKQMKRINDFINYSVDEFEGLS